MKRKLFAVVAILASFSAARAMAIEPQMQVAKGLSAYSVEARSNIKTYTDLTNAIENTALRADLKDGNRKAVLKRLAESAQRSIEFHELSLTESATAILFSPIVGGAMVYAYDTLLDAAKAPVSELAALASQQAPLSIAQRAHIAVMAQQAREYMAKLDSMI